MAEREVRSEVRREAQREAAGDELSAGAREIVTHSDEETTRVGREIGAGLKAPALILLSGDLGRGRPRLQKGLSAGWARRAKRM